MKTLKMEQKVFSKIVINLFEFRKNTFIIIAYASNFISKGVF